MVGGWFLVVGGWFLVVGGWWFVVGCWWLVLGGWWLVVGGWWLVRWLVLGGWWLVVGGWWLVDGSWFLVLGGWWLVVGGWWFVVACWLLVVACWLLQVIPKIKCTRADVKRLIPKRTTAKLEKLVGSQGMRGRSDPKRNHPPDFVSFGRQIGSVPKRQRTGPFQRLLGHRDRIGFRRLLSLESVELLFRQVETPGS